MKVIATEGFKLPFVGKEKFLELMKAGIGYDRENRSFFLKDLENIDMVKGLLRSIIKDDIVFTQRCFICKTPFTCKSCSYEKGCCTSDLPLYCICKSCRAKPDLYDKYLEKGRNLNLT